MTNQNLPSNIPNPDPSVVANERLEEAKIELRREIASRHEESKGWVDALQCLLESKIAGKDNFYFEKFTSIQTQFQERDVRTDQTASQVKLAVDAALQAQKEAAGEQAKSFSAATTKSETAMNRQIEGLDGKITDVKDRLNRVEAMNLGASFNRSESRDQTTLEQHRSQNTIAVVAAIVGTMGILIALAGIIYTATRPASPASVYMQSADPPRLQHNSFPLVPTWESGLYRIAQ